MSEQKTTQQPEQELSEQRRVRREPPRRGADGCAAQRDEPVAERQRQQRHHRNTRIVGVNQGDDHPGQRQVGGHRQINAFGEQHHHLPEGEDDKDGGIVKHLHQIAR